MAALTDVIGAARVRFLRSRESDIGLPPSRKHVDLGVMTTSTKSEQMMSELKAQNTFLEDQVKRLSDQLSKFQTLNFNMNSDKIGGRSGSGFLEVHPVHDRALSPPPSPPPPLARALSHSLHPLARSLTQSVSGDV